MRKFYTISLKTRRWIMRGLLLCGCIIAGIYFWNSVSVKKYPTKIKVSANKIWLPESSEIRKKLGDETEKTMRDAAYEKQMITFYNVLRSNEETKENMAWNNFDDERRYWTGEETRNDKIIINAEDLVDVEFADDLKSQAGFYKIIQTDQNDYQEAYSQLADSKKEQIAQMDWRKKDGILYAVSQKGEYISKTAQLSFYENSRFIKEMEEAGFKGLKQWIHQCNQKKKGVSIRTSKGETALFHDTDQSYEFECQGITFFYNYEKLVMKMDYEKLIKVVDQAKKLPKNDQLTWELQNSSTGGAYGQVSLTTSESEFYCGKKMKIMMKDDKISQLMISAVTSEGKDRETAAMFYIRQEGFYQKERPFLAECLKRMGVSESDAKKWLDQFKFNQKQLKGTIGNCKYELVKDAAEQMYKSYNESKQTKYYVVIYASDNKL